MFQHLFGFFFSLNALFTTARFTAQDKKTPQFMCELEISQTHGLALLGRMVVINFNADQTREKKSCI
jgi:hypothetical protein